IGRHGQARRHAFEDEASLSRFVRRALLRRKSATRRIGVSYEAVEASPPVLPLLRQLGLAVSLPSAQEVGPVTAKLCELATPGKAVFGVTTRSVQNRTLSSMLLISLAFHIRSFAHEFPSNGKFWGFSFQNALSEPIPKARAISKARLACSFVRIVW
ncbi:MAG TPA: hypothetical protein VMU81_04285, partial [Acetobacteraceae bacterium]|nr:hypothetical protein [Acetobacteraceae bacterium]